jgi:hypothetical protein
MGPDAIPVKTDKGKEEIAARKHGLPQALRFALILVDGRSTVAELLQRGAGLPNLGDSLEMLLKMGFIQVRGAATPAGAAFGKVIPGGASAKQALIELARRLLQERSGKIVKKLDDSDESVAALGAAVEGCYKLIKLAIDERRAEQFLAEGRAILARR